MRNLPVIYPWFPVIYRYFPVTTCLAEKTRVILKETSFFLANPAPSRFVYFTAKNLRSQSLVWTRQKVDPNGLATPFQRGSRLSQHAVQAEIIWPSNWADPSPQTQVAWVIVHERVGRNITFHFQPSAGYPSFLHTISTDGEKRNRADARFGKNRVVSPKLKHVHMSRPHGLMHLCRFSCM